MEAILVTAGIVALVSVLVSLMTYISVVGMGKAELQPSGSSVPDIENEWAQANDFEYVGSYRMQTGVTNAEIWAWRRIDRPVGGRMQASQHGAPRTAALRARRRIFCPSGAAHVTPVKTQDGRRPRSHVRRSDSRRGKILRVTQNDNSNSFVACVCHVLPVT